MKLPYFGLRLNVFGVVLFLFLITSASSEVPTTISYQGRLTNSDGNPVADGVYQVRFSLWDAVTGGIQFWSETHSAVEVTNGLFRVMLGSVIPFGIDGTTNPIKASEDAWLSISINAGPESDPRVPLASVPYAFTALRADSAGFTQHAIWADTANFTFRSAWSDSTDFAFGSMWSDTSGYASGSMWSDTSDFAFSSGWTDTAENARSVVDGSISNASIAEGAVNSSSIADGSIELSDIGTNGASNGQIMKWDVASNGWIVVDDNAGSGGIISVLPGSGLSGGGSTPIVTLDISEEGIGPQHIDTGAVRNSELAINAVAAENIQPQVIDNSKIAVNTITSDRIANKTIGGGDLADSTIGWEQLKPNAVVSSRIAPNTIDTSDIATGGVGSDEIADGSVDSSKIAESSVFGNHIAGNQIANSHLAENSVGGSNIQAGSITSTHILDNSITAAHLQVHSVNSDEIAPNAIGHSQLGPDAVKAYNVADDAIIEVSIADNAVNTSNIINGAVTEPKIANNAIGSAKVLDSSLVAADLANEPGVSSSQNKGTVTMGSEYATIDSAEINCPSSGYIFASANISVTLDNGTLQNSYFGALLRLDGSVTGYGSKVEWQKDGVLCTTLPLQFVFPVTSGLHNIKVQGNKIFDGDVRSTKCDLVLMFTPTAYGDIEAPAKSSDINIMPETEM